MSEIQPTNISAAAGTTPAAQGHLRTKGAEGAAPSANPRGEDIGIGVGGVGGGSAIQGSQSVRIEESSSTYSFEQNGVDDKLSMLVAFLIQYLFGKDKEEDKDKDPFRAFAGLMMLSALRQMSPDVNYMETHASQVTYSATTTNSSAVQPTAYSRSGGDAGAGPAQPGENIDVTA